MRKTKGITLIALIITIIVMLILVSVTIRLAVNGGLFEYAKKAVEGTQTAMENEKNLENFSIQQYLNTGESTEQREMTITSSKTSGTNLWSSTVTINAALDEQPEYSLEEKKKIAAVIMSCSDYSQIEDLKPSSLTEKQFVDGIINTMSKWIDYTDINKLESAGIKVIKVETPYGNTLYTNNLTGTVKCTFNNNGTYLFKIKSGGTTKTESVTIDNIRTASNNAPYKVNIYSHNGFLYSVDDTNTWQNMTQGENIISCNSKIKIKFSEEPNQESTDARGLHYIERNEDYYKYYNDEDLNEWTYSLRKQYLINYTLLSNSNSDLATKKRVLANALLSNPSISNLPSRTLLFCQEALSKYGNDTDFRQKVIVAKITGQGIPYPTDFANKYPEFEMGNDNVITWTGDDNVTESPIYTLNVTHDMSLLMYEEIWD